MLSVNSVALSHLPSELALEVIARSFGRRIRFLRAAPEDGNDDDAAEPAAKRKPASAKPASVAAPGSLSPAGADEGKARAMERTSASLLASDAAGFAFEDPRLAMDELYRSISFPDGPLGLILSYAKEEDSFCGGLLVCPASSVEPVPGTLGGVAGGGSGGGAAEESTLPYGLKEGDVIECVNSVSLAEFTFPSALQVFTSATHRTCRVLSRDAGPTIPASTSAAAAKTAAAAEAEAEAAAEAAAPALKVASRAIASTSEGARKSGGRGGMLGMDVDSSMDRSVQSMGHGQAVTHEGELMDLEKQQSRPPSGAPTPTSGGVPTPTSAISDLSPMGLKIFEPLTTDSEQEAARERSFGSGVRGGDGGSGGGGGGGGGGGDGADTLSLSVTEDR